MQAGQQLQAMLTRGLTPQFDTLYTPRQPGALENILTSAAPAAISSFIGG